MAQKDHCTLQTTNTSTTPSVHTKYILHKQTGQRQISLSPQNTNTKYKKINKK